MQIEVSRNVKVVQFGVELKANCTGRGHYRSLYVPQEEPEFARGVFPHPPRISATPQPFRK